MASADPLRGRARTLPLVAVAAVLIGLAVAAPGIVHAMRSDSDLSAPLTMAHDAPDFPGSRMIVGNNGWWTGVWAAQVLFRLPGYSVTGTWVPLLVSIALVGLVAVAAGRRWGWEAGACAALPALAVNPETWVFLDSWDAHAPTWWAMALAGATIVAVAGADGRPRPLGWAGIAATVLVGGGALSGDALVIPAVIVPLLAAALVAFSDRRTAVVVAGLAAATLVSALVCTAVAHALRYSHNDIDKGLRPLGDVPDGVAVAFRDLRALWGDGLPASLIGWLAVALLLVGLVAGTARVLRRATATPDRVWLAFWLVAAVSIFGAYCLSKASLQGMGLRYLVGLAIAAGALAAPVAGLSSSRWALTALGLAVLVGLGGAAGLAGDPAHVRVAAREDKAAAVLRIAREEHLTRGYASYWTAPAMELQLGHELRIGSLTPCPEQGKMCPMFLAVVSGRFRPIPGIRSFLLLDKNDAISSNGGGWVRVFPDGVASQRVVELGDGLQMVIVDHDLASDLGTTDWPE